MKISFTKPLHVLFFLAIFALNLQAQDPYYFIAYSEEYVELTDATSASNGQIWDDPEYVVPIGFDFEIFGESINQLYTLGVGGLTSTGDYYSESPSLIIPYFSDIIDRGYLNGVSESDISYKTEGDPGAQIFTLEWKNVGFYNELFGPGTNADFVNFQLRFFEGTNNIEIHFGPNSIVGEGYDPHEGDAGPGISLFDSFSFYTYEADSIYFLQGATDDPMVVGTDFNGFYYSEKLDGDPANGQVYRFSTVDPSSVVNRTFSTAMKVYPTVVQNEVFVEVDDLDELAGEALIQVVDQTGRVVSTQSLTQNFTTLDLEAFAAGMYFVRIIDQKSSATFKVNKF